MEGSMFKPHSIARSHFSSKCNTATRCVKRSLQCKWDLRIWKRYRKQNHWFVNQYFLIINKLWQDQSSINIYTWKEAAISARACLSLSEAEAREISALLHTTDKCEKLEGRGKWQPTDAYCCKAKLKLLYFLTMVYRTLS